MPYKLLTHQQKPADKLLEVFQSGARGDLLVGQTGCGKTYVLANAVRRAQESGCWKSLEPKPFKLCSILLLTPKKAITQQKRVFFREGVKDFEVVNHRALTSGFGELMISWQDEIVNGVHQLNPVWDEDSKPDVILVDECQFVKNRNSGQTKCIIAAIKQGIKVYLISATPFQKAGESLVVCLACGLANNEREFNDYANLISPGGPDKNSPIAIKRIKQDLEKRGKLIKITNARYPFQPEIKSIYLTLSPEKRVIYDKAWQEYIEACQKDGWDGPQGWIRIAVKKNTFREVAELLKADDIAARAFQVQTWIEQPRQVIIAANYVATLEKVWSILTKKFGVNPNEIATLWGGQSEKQSDANIDGFQEGSKKYFLTTLASGGTSLSLDHQAQFPLALPRYVITGLDWSVFKMIQLLGRAQRIMSASQTLQEIVAFKDTVEEEVERRLEEKFDCLRELLERKDTFIHDIFNSKIRHLVDSKLIEKMNEELDNDEKNQQDKDDDDAKEETDLGFLGPQKEFGE